MPSRAASSAAATPRAIYSGHRRLGGGRKKHDGARAASALLARWADHPRVDLITTDGFLHPNAELERRGLMDRKGFPESFDTARLLNFLHDVKSGRENVEAPVYSHFHYDIIPGQSTSSTGPTS